MSDELSRIATDGSVVLYSYAFSVDIEEDQQRINTTVWPYYYRQCRYCMYVPLVVPHGIAIANASPISETDRFGERVREVGHSTIQPFKHSTIQPFNHGWHQYTKGHWKSVVAHSAVIIVVVVVLLIVVLTTKYFFEWCWTPTSPTSLKDIRHNSTSARTGRARTTCRCSPTR